MQIFKPLFNLLHVLTSSEFQIYRSLLSSTDLLCLAKEYYYSTTCQVSFDLKELTTSEEDLIVKIIMKKDSKKNPPKKAPALRQSATATTQAETTTTPTISTTTVSNVATTPPQPTPLFTRHELNQMRQRERIIAERK